MFSKRDKFNNWIENNLSESILDLFNEWEYGDIYTVPGLYVGNDKKSVRYVPLGHIPTFLTSIDHSLKVVED